MSYYIVYIHVWSANIVILLFILSTIGYILKDAQKNTILNKQLLKYYNIVFIILIITGTTLLANNLFWISFPTFQYKLIMVLVSLSLSIIYYRNEKKSIPISPIYLIISFLVVYSLSMVMGSYTHG